MYGRVNWGRISPLGPPQTHIRQQRERAGLPAAWVEQVRKAAMTADAAQLLRLAAQVAENQPALADALRARVAEFDYRLC